MSDTTAKARRTDVQSGDPLIADHRYDYADAFEIDIDPDDPRTAEEFTRDALERAPVVIRETVRVAWGQLLRFRLGPHPSADHVLGMGIRSSGPDALGLGADGPLLAATLVVRRTPESRVVIATYISYVRPRPAWLVWAAVGVLHRRLAGVLLERATLLDPVASSAGADEAKR